MEETGKFTAMKGEDNWMRQERINVYYNETECHKFVPRAILADLDSASIESIKGGSLGKLFRPESMLSEGSGTGGNWGKGHYTKGGDLASQVIELARKEAELCDCLQGIQITHSIGGGTGSGMGTLVMSKLMEERMARVTASFTHTPHSKVPAGVTLEPYNAILSLHQLIENIHQVYLFDNNAVNNISDKFLKLQNPDDEIRNQIISSAMTGITAGLRFSGHNNQDFVKLGVNLIPFPRLCFFLTGLSTFSLPNTKPNSVGTMSDLAYGMVNPEHYLATRDPIDSSKNISLVNIFRGRMSVKETDELVHTVQSDHRKMFATPNCVKSAVCNLPSGTGSGDTSATYIANTTAVQFLLRDVLSQFDALFKKKVYLSMYTGEGMDEMEFTEARTNVEDLLSEYSSYK